MDENEKQAQNNVAVADNSQSESPAEEPKTAPEVETAEVEAEPASSEETESKPTEGERVKSRSAEGRIKELVRERNEARAKASDLSNELRQITDKYRFKPENLGGFPQQQPTQEEPNIQAGREYTVEELNAQMQRARQIGEQNAMKQADYIVQMRMAQQENLNRINSEAQELMSKYEALNPKSEKFDPDLSGAITEAISDLVKANPHASVKKYGERLMKPYMKSVTKAEANLTESVAKQVYEQASRPTPAVSQESTRDLKKSSWKDIEKEVGIVG